MSESSGIGGTPLKPTETSESGGPTGEPSSASVESALKTPVRTLGELKKMLIEKLGHKKGLEMYNRFLTGIGQVMYSQMQTTKAHPPPSDK